MAAACVNRSMPSYSPGRLDSLSGAPPGLVGGCGESHRVYFDPATASANASNTNATTTALPVLLGPLLPL